MNDKAHYIKSDFRPDNKTLEGLQKQGYKLEFLRSEYVRFKRHYTGLKQSYNAAGMRKNWNWAFHQWIVEKEPEDKPKAFERPAKPVRYNPAADTAHNEALQNKLKQIEAIPLEGAHEKLEAIRRLLE